ncbi:MAG: ABC transporter permease [Actinobacteria bacterium]|nr:ABC transporter permease [Actinomycetota bacterium]
MSDEQPPVEREVEEAAAEQELAQEQPRTPTGGDYAPSVAKRLDLYQRAGGIVTPLLTTIIAFLIGGLVVLASGSNPLSTYRAIFDGTGLNWLFPWVTGADRTLAATNLQQTLLLMTPLILTGLAVAFAFRCGMFNIGGQGQYTVGTIMSVWVASAFVGMNGPVHILLALAIGTLSGAMWAGIAGFLKATVGAHEVISTIMLNWIAYWIGSWVFALGGPLQSHANGASVPVSHDIQPNTHLHVFWGDPILQGLHVGFFIALACLVVYWATLNRTTLGFSVRAVGFNPEAARYGGIRVARNYFTALAISGMFAGLAGAIDVLGWEFHIDVNDIQASSIGFTGIAVALLGRNTAVGVFFSSLLFAALVNGTSTRHLDPTIFRPDLAGNLTLIIQGLVVLFVGADVLVLWFWNQRKKIKLRRHALAAQAAVMR